MKPTFLVLVFVCLIEQIQGINYSKIDKDPYKYKKEILQKITSSYDQRQTRCNGLSEDRHRELRGYRRNRSAYYRVYTAYNESFKDGKTFTPLYAYFKPIGYFNPKGYFSESHKQIYYDGYGYNFYYGKYSYYEASKTDQPIPWATLISLFVCLPCCCICDCYCRKTCCWEEDKVEFNKHRHHSEDEEYCECSDSSNHQSSCVRNKFHPQNPHNRNQRRAQQQTTQAAESSSSSSYSDSSSYESNSEDNKNVATKRKSVAKANANGDTVEFYVMGNKHRKSMARDSTAGMFQFSNLNNISQNQKNNSGSINQLQSAYTNETVNTLSNIHTEGSNQHDYRNYSKTHPDPDSYQTNNISRLPPAIGTQKYPVQQKYR